MLTAFVELFEGSEPTKNTAKSAGVPMDGSNLLLCPS